MILTHGRIQRLWSGGRGFRTPPENSQVVKGFLRNTGTDPLEKQFDPVPIASREMLVALCEERCNRTTSSLGCI